jgi:FlaG/FlaF family flagellin (archaellin)
MGQLETLAPDQRAVLELVLRRGRSYGELADLLAIPETEVRARADAGVRALAGDPAEGVDSGRICDWLLGQQPEADAERTRVAVARSAAAREWAEAAAERLREVGGDVPEVPAAAGDVSDAGDAPAASSAPAGARPRSSKLGGAILIGAVVVVAAAALAFLLLGDGDEDDPSAAAQRGQAQQDAASEPQQAGNDVVLRGRGGSDAGGLMRLFQNEDGTVQFAIAAQNVPPNRGRETYAVWFTRANGDARRLGFAQTQVGENGVLTTGGPQVGDEDRFPRWFATYDKVLVTRETDAEARRPGPVVLEGTLPSGR